MEQAFNLRGATPICIIPTRNRDQATLFYRDILGLRLLREDHFAAVFETGGVMIRVSVVPDWTAHSHAILGFDVADIETAVKALVAKGVAFNRYEGFNQDESTIWTSPDKSVRVAWFNDRDGNVLSLTEFASS